MHFSDYWVVTLCRKEHGKLLTRSNNQNSFLTLTVKQTHIHSLPYPFCLLPYETMRDIDSNSAAIVMELWDTARYEGDNFYANFGQVTLDRYVCL